MFVQVKPTKAQLLKSNYVKTVPSLLLLSKHENALHAHAHIMKLQNVNHVHCFQSGFRCRDHSTSSERRQNLQKRHEKPLNTSQSSRTEQSPEPLYFEVALDENCFCIIVAEYSV